MKPRILISGATGFIGANLSYFFLKKNFNVHIFLRQNSNPWRLTGILSRLNKHQVDLRQRRKLNQVVKLIRPQVIIHTAAASIYRNQQVMDHEMIDINLTGTVNIINAVNELDYQAFIHTGSSSEYGTRDKPMQETDVCLPKDIYGVTKLAATRYVQVIARRNHKPVVTLRLFSPFGPLESPKRLIPYAIGRALTNQSLHLANPQGVRDFIYIEDVVAAYAKAIKFASKHSGEIFNIGSGKQHSVQLAINTIIKATKSTSELKWDKVPASQQDTDRWQANITKASKLLSWQPSNSFQAGIKKSIHFYKKRHNE